MNGLHGIIFSYEKRNEMQELGQIRSAASIPFGGRYRAVDFALSSLVNAGCTDVGIVLHGHYQSLLDHLGTGKAWDLSRKRGGLRMLPPFNYQQSWGAMPFRGHMEALAGVRSYLDTIRGLNLTDYVSYNATDDELKTYGLDEPDLDVALKYREATDEGEEEKEGTVVLHISRDPEEKKEAETDSQEEITAYARIGKSKIIYKINGADYEELMKASCNDLRHQEAIWVDSDKISQAEISLEGTEYKLKTKKKDKKKVWYYQKKEIEADDFCYALNSLSTSEFTGEKPTGKEEISLLLQIDDENQPEVRIELYRYDGNNCLAVVDGEPVSLINRSYVVNLIEAVNAIVLN